MNRRCPSFLGASCILAASTALCISSISAASTRVPYALSSYQSARILDRGEIRSTVAVTRDDLMEDDQPEAGLTILDLQKRIPILPGHVDGSMEFSICRPDDRGGPGAAIGGDLTCAVWPNHIAVMMSLDMPLAGLILGPLSGADFHPTVIGSLRPSSHLDITASASKHFLSVGDDPMLPIMSYTLGVGISRDVQRWALRPELGWVRSQEHRWSQAQFGIGLELPVEF